MVSLAISRSDHWLGMNVDWSEWRFSLILAPSAAPGEHALFLTLEKANVPQCLARPGGGLWCQHTVSRTRPKCSLPLTVTLGAAEDLICQWLLHLSHRSEQLV